MANLLWVASERAEAYPLITQVQKKITKYTLSTAARMLCYIYPPSPVT